MPICTSQDAAYSVVDGRLCGLKERPTKRQDALGRLEATAVGKLSYFNKTEVLRNTCASEPRSIVEKSTSGFKPNWAF